ncbi:hypothetical protein [Flavobacterium sp. UBA7682]|uniref:hypothetical protein n=1 Tax=Flavobacterium sp. UBA7682 TaxID=1946560 RepID=UPI0025B98D17|nr:hypothetical protein [Flavobacterium sp. UBA7682]
MKKLKLMLILITALFVVDFGLAQVGINTSNPLSTLDINGNLSVKTITLTGSGSATLISDGVYISIAPQATDQEFRLPSAVAFPGRVYIIRNIQNSITAKLTSAVGLLFPKGSTVGSADIYMFEGSKRSIIVISDGANWTYFD